MARNSKKKLRNRAVAAFLITIVFGFGIGIVGLFSVGLVHGSENRQKAESELLSDTVISARRGTIYDRNGNVLAQSADAWKIYINPSEIKDDETAQEVAQDLSTIIKDVKYKEAYKAAKKSDYTYVVVATKVDHETEKAIEALRTEKYEQGYGLIIGIEDDVERYYPYDNFASTILGFTGNDDSGRSGLETYYNSTLTGVAGRSIASENAKQDEMSSDSNVFFEATNGTSLKLTIDDAIQYYLDSSLSNAVRQLEAHYGYGIVMDVDTGAILAMSSQPDYDCNDPYTITDKETKKAIDEIKDKDKKAQAESDALFAQWRNRTITDTYEPGSVFKCITAAAGIEEGVVSPDEMFVCTGSYQVEDRTYHCSYNPGHGEEDFTTSLMNSCNPIYIQVAQRLGSETFSKYFDAFGFSETTGVDLPAEAIPTAGVTYYSVDKMGAVQLASSSFGQTFQVTPIQIITAINAIANDGKLMTPYIVDEFLDQDGNAVSKTKPHAKRQVVSKLTADAVTDMMVEVVKGGTAANAYVPGYKVAGKTGTSEKLTMGDGYYIGSFAGFAPADDPQIAVLIAIDEPMGGNFTGGKTAAPVAAEVIENTLKYLNVEPEYTEEEKAELDVKTPNAVGLSVDDIRAELQEQGFTVEVIGKGDKVVRQMPAAGKLVPQKGIVVLYTEADLKTRKVEVPNLVGMTETQARYWALRSGLNVEVVGDTSSGASLRQNIEPGTTVAIGSTVTVTYISGSNEMNIEDTGNAD